MKVFELVAILGKAPQTAEVECTWEGTTPGISAIYVAKDGRVLIDSDDNRYFGELGDPSQGTLFEWQDEDLA